MAISQTTATESVIKRILLDDVFWERVTSSLRILKPIAATIAKIEGDTAILSDVKCLFAELKEELQTVLPTSLLLQAEDNCSGQINGEAPSILCETNTRSSIHARPKTREKHTLC